MQRLTTAYDRVLEALGLLPGLLVAVIAVGTCADVFLRNLGYSGLYGMLEITEYSLLILTLAGAGFIMRVGRHVTVDILAEHLPPRLARPVAVAAALLGTAFCVIFLWYSVLTVIDAHQSGSIVQRTFVIPEWWVIAVIPAGFLFLTIEMTRRLYTTLTSRDVQRTGSTGRDGGI